MSEFDRSIGVDVGGTFTDVVLVDRGHLYRAKAPTTKPDLETGILKACASVAELVGMGVSELLPTIGRFGLGTTAVTNALASRQGRTVGLLTTHGFEDLLVLARGRRESEDGWLVPPAQVVPRERIVGVRERIDREGEVVEPLEPGEVVSAGEALVAGQGVEALVVSFLWSIRNPKHEQVAVETLNRRFPGLHVVAASSLHPALREFERTMFAVLNAFVSECFLGLDSLAGQLRSLGLNVPILLVHSAGGALTMEEARAIPLALAQSGPAAGAAAARDVAVRCGVAQAVACDMGGTSLDVSLIVDGALSRVTRGDLMGFWTALPRIDVDSIGAGGGSIGWMDSRGMLRVGPRSAGAYPGPACYDRGGKEATVTDALTVLGYLDPAGFLGGRMPLNAVLAGQACSELGRQMELGQSEAAAGIHQLTAASMARSVRRRLAERGLDPRNQAVISYGGCAGLFAAEIASRVGATRVIVPEEASVLSALGAATAQIRRERIEAVSLRLPGDGIHLAPAIERLSRLLHADLEGDVVPPADRSVTFEVDVRFANQAWELAIPLQGNPTDPAVTQRLIDDFRAEYTRRYGQSALLFGVPIEVAAVRGIGLGTEVNVIRSSDLTGHWLERDGELAPTGKRRVRRADGDRHEVPVYQWTRLQPGDVVSGPALVDGTDTSVWVPSEAVAKVDPVRALILDLAPGDLA